MRPLKNLIGSTGLAVAMLVAVSGCGVSVDADDNAAPGDTAAAVHDAIPAVLGADPGGDVAAGADVLAVTYYYLPG